MNFKLDENIPEDAAIIFIDAGYRVSTVLDQGLGGKADSEIAAACKVESKALITFDTDFSNIGAYPPEDYSGIIVLRLANQAKPHVHSILARLLDSIEKESLSGHLWIVDEDHIRIRPGGE
jgi:predicted nuclease of predicted toxin-antitoxin system